MRRLVRHGLHSFTVKYDDAGIHCRNRSPWDFRYEDHSTGECVYRDWISGGMVSPPFPPRWQSGDWDYERWDWTCNRLEQTIEIDGEPIRRRLSGYRAQDGSDFSCRYTFPRSVLNNFSSQLDQFDVDLGTSLKPAVTVGHDIFDPLALSRGATPIGWAVRWTLHTPAQWPPGCTRLGPAHRHKPCWPTFDPDVRMSPRLDTLTVGTPVWVWLNNVRKSCLPAALPTPPSPDCGQVQPNVWETWPRDEADPNTWRHEKLQTPGTPGTFSRAVFPQKVSITLVGGGGSFTYECWTDDHVGPVDPGEWAPGQRPFSSHPGGPGQLARTGPLATPTGPLNPGVGDCTFRHHVAGPHTATVTIHWIGKEGPSWPDNSVTWGDPPVGQEPLPTSQTVTVVFYEMHTIPGP